MTKMMFTYVPDAVKKRAISLAKKGGLTQSGWLRSLILVATQDTPAGRIVRGKVAEALAVGDGQ